MRSEPLGVGSLAFPGKRYWPSLSLKITTGSKRDTLERRVDSWPLPGTHQGQEPISMCSPQCLQRIHVSSRKITVYSSLQTAEVCLHPLRNVRIRRYIFEGCPSPDEFQCRSNLPHFSACGNWRE